jgi:dTMP kinase
MKKLIVLEGPDGVGKSTQANLLGTRLIKKGYNALVYSQPSWEFRQLIQNDFADIFLFLADRALQVREYPDNNFIVSDRYLLSTLAYQCIGQVMDKNIYNAVVSLHSLLPVPDITLVLERTRPVERNRRLINSDDRRVINFYRQVQSDQYLGKIVRVDGDGSEESVGSRIDKALISIGIV